MTNGRSWSMSPALPPLGRWKSPTSSTENRPASIGSLHHARRDRSYRPRPRSRRRSRILKNEDEKEDEDEDEKEDEDKDDSQIRRSAIALIVDRDGSPDFLRLESQRARHLRAGKRHHIVEFAHDAGDRKRMHDIAG